MQDEKLPKHMIQLDGLRAIAAAMVVFGHLYPHGPVQDMLNWGYIGVRLFFVLSGFLITGILLDARPPDGRGRPAVLRAFYARRALRIFPIYYLTLAAVAVFSKTTNYIEMFSLLTYSLNWYFSYFSMSASVVGGLSLAPHFWSLAVEEQFYLFWPWLILYLPRRAILPAIAATIALAPAVRLVLVARGFTVTAITFNTFGCLDTLGAGALLAYARRAWGRAAAGAMARRAGLAAVPLLFISLPNGLGLWPTHYILLFTLQDFSLGCLFLWLIWAAAEEATGVAGGLLSAAPVVYIGRISYGIYVYHEFLEKAAPWLFASAGLPHPGVGYPLSIGLTVASIALAALSWHLIESPVNGLKRRFPYRAPDSV